ncbi:MAG: EAL domain-containing protein [Methylicorpusculum sp.]|uniref:EAL domain-containing protein n=1 Tax=Methylicorpusculum sp. TaxID=2713644 RepID=UPI00271C65C9|nr:EAL domain-containing protein [Methylicorpusculum sp.]MDO8940478.1 EAL domain-containing protein [Methylicorpusculum sp.]MDP2203696.1 EAL domain-containing protein [Methylicorpusculum sp.]
MMLSKSLQRKKIIIAGLDSKLVIAIEAMLLRKGFSNLSFANECADIYRIIRPFAENSVDLGLVIVDEFLPGGDVGHMCTSLSRENNGIALPFIILKAESSDQLNDSIQSSGDLIYDLYASFREAELLILVELLLVLKNERYLRNQQQEKLISELATRKLLDAKLKYLIAHDELTGLMNRANLEQHIRLSLMRFKALHQNGALLLIDLDRFGLINDLEGFDVADRLIIEVVALIRKTLTRDVFFARIDSDEFCLYFENVSLTQAKESAEAIRKSLDECRFTTGDVCYNITASIGIAALPTQKVIVHPEELISKAHQACYLAKQNGRNMVWIYNEDDKAIKERHRDVFWVPLIREALIDKNFFLVFQPVINLKSGIVSHYEVLIRMRGQADSVIHPIEFIPVAERMGLIHCIDIWVVENAIDFLAALPVEMSDVCLAINLSGFAFQDGSLLPTLKRKLDLSWVNADRITFEITETAAVDNFDQTRQMINKIRALGCHFALDDFGAGFCSFNYLKKFPVDYVKIDGQFIRNLVNDETDQVLVKSMADVARKLGKKTVAEFIEVPQVIPILVSLGIEFGQGYLFGKPCRELIDGGRVPLAQFSNESETKSHFSYNRLD